MSSRLIAVGFEPRGLRRLGQDSASLKCSFAEANKHSSRSNAIGLRDLLNRSDVNQILCRIHRSCDLNMLPFKPACLVLIIEHIFGFRSWVAQDKAVAALQNRAADCL